MKKNWIAPELMSLDIADTAGGKYYTAKVDDIVYNEKLETWQHILGSESLSP